MNGSSNKYLSNYVRFNNIGTLPWRSTSLEFQQSRRGEAHHRSMILATTMTCIFTVMVTREQHVILPSTPLFLVDRSWRSTSKASNIHFDWQSSVEKSRSVTLRNKTLITVTESLHGTETLPKARAAGRQSKSQQDQICETRRTFEFINATNLEHTRDPEVQRLVKSHVKKGVPRHKAVTYP